MMFAGRSSCRVDERKAELVPSQRTSHLEARQHEQCGRDEDGEGGRLRADRNDLFVGIFFFFFIFI